ncbi:conserved Plasmodium protein, unknown function [Plasmodium ovale wallikeri]|uniref:Replication factor A protein 3 n=2 Tax=Plasmodium ovale TaxID=36330 RepID=A0A1A8YGN8_PLAOA|nr:conserved Plasmodium protein, unknown function [Plasmodium ovale wallikeri]SBT30846.1 conserved Plasmodium protein, unknown function [Plasmodium ovale wallikeri]
MNIMNFDDDANNSTPAYAGNQYNLPDMYKEGSKLQNEEFGNNKVGKLISEKYLSEFVNEEIFFIGEIMNRQENVITLKSVNGNHVECIIKDRNLKVDSKYVGIKGTVSNDLKIIETRGIVFLEDVNFEIVNEYINIYMQYANSDVFLSSY